MTKRVKIYRIVRHDGELHIYDHWANISEQYKTARTYFSYEVRYKKLCTVLDLMGPNDGWDRAHLPPVRVYYLGRDEFDAIVGSE